MTLKTSIAARCIAVVLAAIAIVGANAKPASLQSGSVEKATLSDLAFIAGQWRGELQGGITEENWSAPAGDAMMGVFRYVKGGKAVFYELLLIEMTSAGPVLRLKHFHPGLRGWEEKDEVFSYALVDLRKERAVFERTDKNSRLIFQRTSDATMSIWLERTKDEKTSSEEFKYRLAR
ncbi:MAG: DUF6265 family protein [Acidobacteriota bacterium]